MKTVRRLLYRDIVSAVAFVALAFLSLFFFIDFVDELGDIGKRGYRVHAAAAAALLGAGPLLRAVPDRGADRHHLLAGAPGAVVGIHDPAHRRPRPGAGAGAARRAGAGLRRRSPSSSATTWRRFSETSPPAAGAASRGGPARPRRRLAEGPAAPRPGDRSVSVNVAAPEADGTAPGSASSSSTPTAACCARTAAAEAASHADGRWCCTTSRITHWPRRIDPTARASEQLAHAALAEHAARPAWSPPPCCR